MTRLGDFSKLLVTIFRLKVVQRFGAFLAIKTRLAYSCLLPVVRLRVHVLGQAEVADLDDVVFRQENVSGGQISVDDPFA